MPNLPISQLPQSTTLQGDELFVNVQGGVTKYTTLDSMFDHHAQHISCYSSASQALAVSGSAQAATFTSVWTNDGITVEEGSKITFANAGVYKLNFIAQIANSDNAVHDSYFWVKYNGNDFPSSGRRMTLQARKNASTPSGQIMTVAIVGVAQNDGDYIQLYWTGDSTLNSLRYTPATAVIPAIPSIIASVIRVG